MKKEQQKETPPQKRPLNQLPPIQAELTKEQSKAISQLRAKVTEFSIDDTDDYVLRWLKARNYNVDEAADMYRASMKWRKDNDVDNVATRLKKRKWFKPLQEYWPGAPGRTKDGQLVYWECIGRVDPKGLLTTFPEDVLIDFHVHMMELCEQEREKLKNASGFTAGVVVIQDLSGLGFHHVYTPGLNLFKKIIAIDEANYPDDLRRLYILNCPKIFTFLWGIIKPWLDKCTLEKIKVVGSEYQEVLDLIKPEDLPDHLGGPLKGLVPLAGKLNFDAEQLEPDEEDKKESEKLKVSVADFYSIQVNVVKPGTIIAWEFSTEQNDIQFAIYYQKNKILRRCVYVKRSNMTPIKLLYKIQLLHKKKAFMNCIGTTHIVG